VTLPGNYICSSANNLQAKRCRRRIDS